MGNKTITVKSNEENPEPVELIAKSIIEIADAFQKIQASRLTRHALVILIKDRTTLSQKAINAVLDTVADLKKFYIKDAPKKV